ncbi:BnaC08g04530D [Brassica napus]|uniref:BnaC08g04530D protein n=1 Tax=Brassica napus TaxID=3708 RepID=A0A078FXD7_BRANA|nr:BnaC08g04530D [Brassica napus]
MTALDYIKNQPRLQDKHLTHTTNTFSALAEFPPLSYAKAASPNPGQTSSKQATPTQKSDYHTKSYYQHIHTTNFPKPITLKELENYINRVWPGFGLAAFAYDKGGNSARAEKVLVV